MVRFGFCHLPEGVTWRHIHGVSLLAGIGFTVSLFVTELAYVNDHHTADIAKVGILLASFIAGSVGFYLLKGVQPTESTAPLLQTDDSL
jgi:Na+:H+ antiporter, NhaA family